MPELIDRQTVRLLESDADAYTGNWNDDYEKGFCDAIYKVLKLPTIEAEPVRHGQWLSYTGTHYTGKEDEYGDPEYKEHIFFVCSNCRRKTVVREHFCPNCGAKMTGD